MISVKEAKELIQQSVKSLPAVSLSLIEASGLILAEDVYAITDIPAFAQSSMDGYAIRYCDKDGPLSVYGEMAAGTAVQIAIVPEQAVRIFTGAPLPDGADTVVMQEKVSLKDGQLILQDEQLKQFTNVRLKGAEVKSGVLAVPEGTLLTAAAVGFLAGIGITKVKAYPAPVVAIILTGNELQQPGKTLEFGQVYESNSIMLKVALKNSGLSDVLVLHAEDDLIALQVVLDQALQQADIVLLTGGVSVGDYDFVIRAAMNCNIKQVFHKIRQKPGKPLFFGTKENKLVFGLPGNPSSVLTCFYEYVMPAIDLIMKREASVKILMATLSHDYSKSTGLTHFLKAKLTGEKVTPLQAQESFRLQSFSQANCLIVLPENSEHLKIGDEVEVHLLPIQ
jgi:molybdopterin molybdotransferase